MKNYPALLALVLLASMSSAPLPAQDSPSVQTVPAAIKLGVGFDYSRGDYGFARETEVLSAPVNLSYEQDRWLIRATLPYLSVKGPASVVAGGGSGAVATAPGRPLTAYESGVGDALLGVTYHARPVPGALNVDFSGRVKFGTADENKGLGTGETDYYTQVDLYQTFGAVTPFVSVGYRFLGPSALYPLEDGAYATGGASYRLTPSTVIGAAYDWRSRIVAGAPNATDALVFVSTNPNDSWNLLGYFLTGFNDASPDYGFGGAATYRF